jgi:hypothetical protein
VEHKSTQHFIQETEREKPLGRRMGNNIKINFKETGSEGVHLVLVTQNRAQCPVILPLCLIKHHAMKMRVGNFTYRPLCPWRKIAQCPRIEGLMGSRDGLNAAAKKKCPAPAGNKNPSRPTFSQTL